MSMAISYHDLVITVKPGGQDESDIAHMSMCLNAVLLLVQIEAGSRYKLNIIYGKVKNFFLLCDSYLHIYTQIYQNTDKRNNLSASQKRKCDCQIQLLSLF